MSNAATLADRSTRDVVARVVDLKKDYHLGNNVVVSALRGISLEFVQGDFVAIMGASGSGKTGLITYFRRTTRQPGAGWSKA